VSRWSGGDVKGLSPVVVLGDTAMPSAAGAYAIATNTIYLNADWLRNARAEQVLDVLNEENGGLRAIFIYIMERLIHYYH
jgi:hypothetical protein